MWFGVENRRAICGAPDPQAGIEGAEWVPRRHWTRDDINTLLAADQVKGWVGVYGRFRGPSPIHDVALCTVRKRLRWLMTNSGVKAETGGWITDQLVLVRVLVLVLVPTVE